MSNKYIKKLVFGEPDTSGRRVTIMTRENKIIRCQVGQNGHEFLYPYHVTLDGPPTQKFSLSHCSTGSYYISDSVISEADVPEQVSVLAKVMKLGCPPKSLKYFF